MNKAELDELRDHYDKCMKIVRSWGLEPFEIDFHVVPADKMYEIASYGVPGHYGHWTYGRDYWRQKTSYDYGHSKIYELVINSDPAQAFLLDVNSMHENMFVIAHVAGHSDFFANNVYFEHTNRHIEHSVAATANRFREYEMKYGRYVVENWIDDAISISEHIDPQLRTVKKTKEYEKARPRHAYLDMFPDQQEEEWADRTVEEIEKYQKFPYEPDRDILRFIAEHGKMHDWQRDVLMSVREEAIYMLPQMQTKIMNEGWASLIHRKLMHEIDPACDPGGVYFAHLHSGVLNGRGGALNPYWLGYNMFHRIIERWDNPSDEDRETLGLTGGEGWQQALEVRSLDSDESFIRNYLDEKLCNDLDLFAYAYNEDDANWSVTDKDWTKVRDILTANKANMGMPYIVVEDADYKHAANLYLKHEFDGRDLHVKYLTETLKAVERLWGRPVHLETIVDGEPMLYSCTGKTIAVTAVND